MEQELATAPIIKKEPSLVGKIVKWAFLALIFATCFMAAYRKFGG
jgi:TRAP-type mannitol/chloroaromatic compound transport system permease small subunit